MKFKPLAALAAGTALMLGLSACSSGASSESPDASAVANASGEVTLRLWDENAAKAYEESIKAFEAKYPQVKVKINVVPWNDYFTTLRTDVASGSADDLFWLNGANVSDYASNGKIRNINEFLGADAAKQWESTVVEQYTTDDSLWGVPQLTDGGIAMFYNTKLLAEAGVTPEELSAATWNPEDPSKDTLLPLLQKLTIDNQGRNAADPAFDPKNVKTYGFNAAHDLQNVMLEFIGGAGGTFQDAEGNLTLTNPKTEQGIQYLVDLINKYHVAPPATSTNGNGDFTRDEFLKGNLAVFQSGTYNLKNVSDGAKFEWGVTELSSGPDGKVTVAPGVIVAANADSKNAPAQKLFLEWLGSKEGNEFFGTTGAAVPAVTAAREAYDAYWKKQNVDVAPFFTVLKNGKVMQAVIGKNFSAQYQAYTPKVDEVFTGRVSVKDGLKAAQEAAEKAV